MEANEVQSLLKDLLPDHLGFQLTRTEPDHVEAHVTVRKELCTGGDIMHGGALMALADTVGACGALVNLETNQGTTTLESKTNFFSAAPIGETVIAISRPLHRGKRTQVWQTDIRTETGKLVAQVTQTQMTLGA